MEEFATSFNEADILILTEIYAASEDPIEGISGSNLAEKIRMSGHKNVIFAPTREDVVQKIVENARAGDIVLTLGAGDLYRIDEKLVSAWTGKV
jgi:UDP-N-acetylmuramate--alanine ligase